MAQAAGKVCEITGAAIASHMAARASHATHRRRARERDTFTP